MARFHSTELKWEACSGCRREKGVLKWYYRMATVIQTWCHSHGDPAYTWVSPDQGTKNNFSICRKGSASAPEITKWFQSFLASERVYSPWAFGCASGMPRVHIEPSWHRKWLNSRLCCSQHSRPSAVCLATKIPKTLMCPATSEALERPFPLPLPPEEMGASRRQAEYLWVELDCSKLVLWPPEGASTDDIGKKNLLQARILSGDITEYISQQIWLSVKQMSRAGVPGAAGQTI